LPENNTFIKETDLTICCLWPNKLLAVALLNAEAPKFNQIIFFVSANICEFKNTTTLEV